MLYYYFVYYFPLALAIGPALLWVYLRVRSHRHWRAILLPLSISGLILAGLMVLGTLPQATRNGWCASRLTPPIAWVHGDSLYHGPSEGPLLVRMYGPVYAMVYTPAALSCRPTGALLTGAIINLLLFVGPTFWFLRAAGRETCATINLGVGAVLAVLIATTVPLLDVAALVTVDAPAIGFAVCACAVLVGRTDAQMSLRRAIVCGLFAAASAWSKQTFAPLVAALAVYMLLIAPPRFTGVMLLTFALFSAVVMLLLGPKAMIYQMLTIPSLQPTAWPALGRSAGVLRGIRIMWRETALIEWTMVAAVMLNATRRASGGVRTLARESPWLLTFLVWLALLPATMLAYTKVAGDANNLAPQAYFALLTVAAAVQGLSRKSGPPNDVVVPRARIAMIGMVMLILVSPWLARKEIRGRVSNLSIWSQLAQSDQEQAFNYMRNHPGAAYFPQYGLATLLAEGRAYHLDLAIVDLHRAGIHVSRDQIAIGLPPRMEQVVWRSDPGGEVQSLLPQFNHVTEVPELPGWTVLQRDPAAREP